MEKPLKSAFVYNMRMYFITRQQSHPNENQIFGRYKYTLMNFSHNEQTGYPPVREMVRYTNGSVCNGSAGGKGYVENTTSCFSLPMRTSLAFLTEVVAIKTICDLPELKTAKGIAICFDSKSAIQATEALTVRSGLVLDCKKLLASLSSPIQVRLIWVPRHSGIEGNEKQIRWQVSNRSPHSYSLSTITRECISFFGWNWFVLSGHAAKKLVTDPDKTNARLTIFKETINRCYL